MIQSPITGTMNHPPLTSPFIERTLTTRAAWWLLVLLSCLYALLSSGRIRTPDEYMQFFQTQSLVVRGSSTVPQAVRFGNFYGMFDRQGRPRAPYPPGQAFMASPLLFAARFGLLRLPGVPHTQDAILYVQAFGAVLSSAVCAAGAMALFFLILRRLGVSLLNSLLATFSVALGTLLLPYSGYFFSEPFTTLVLMAAVYEVSGKQLHSKNALIAGLLLAFAVWIRPTMGLAAALFAVALLVRNRWSGLRQAIIVFAVPAVAGLGYLLWNKMLFGSAVEFGYPGAAEMGKQLNSFHTPFYVGLYGFLFSPGKSIFLYLPPMLLAIAGTLKLWKRDRAIASLAVGLPVTYLLFYMSYTQWEGGYCPGPRYLLPFLCVTCLALGPLLESGEGRVRRILCGLAGLGLVVQAITYGTSFLEDQVTGAYYDASFSYRMSYDPIVSQGARLIAYITGKPGGLGLGFDRWFVFLHQLGVPAPIEVLMAVIPTLVLIVAALQLNNLILLMRRSQATQGIPTLAEQAGSSQVES